MKFGRKGNEARDMMYVFICTNCGEVRMVSGSRSVACSKCGEMMAACEKDFLQWTDLGQEERTNYIEQYKKRARTEKLIRYRPMPKYDRIERGY